MSDEYGVQEQFGNMSIAQRGEPPVDCLIGDNGTAPIIFQSIIVNPPILKGSNRFNQHHVYPIATVPSSEGVTRRYSEFEWLYLTLVSMYPGVFVPPIPPKKMFGAKDDSFIETQRRPGLERFLNRCSKIPIIAESAPFQAFVSRTHSFDLAQKDITKQLSLRSHEQLMKTYEYYYPMALEQDLPVSIDQDLLALLDFSKQREARLTEMAYTANELHASVQKQLKLLGKLTTDLTNAEQTETAFQFVPSQQTKVSNADSIAAWVEHLTEAEPHFNSNLFLQYVNELEDTQSFIALLNERKSLQSKSQKANAKANSWDGHPASTDKQRNQRAADYQQAEEDAKLALYASKIIWFEQFQSLWATVVEEYNRNATQFSLAQASYAQLMYHNFESFNSAHGVGNSSE